MAVLVLGGGVTGLAAAHYLRQLRPTLPITVLEAAPAVGGWVRTTRHKDGGLWEHGPRTVRPAGQQGVNTLQLVEQLQLTERLKIIPQGHPATLNRMIMTGGELHKLPTSLWSTLRWLKPFRRPLALAALRDLAAPARRGLADDSLYAFVARRFGSDVAQFAVDPLVRGVCAGDARQISVRFLMDTLFEHEQRYGSVLWGMWKERGRAAAPDPGGSELARRAQAERWSVWSLEGGLQTLPEAMAARLAADGVAVLPDAPATRLELSPDGATVHSPAGSHHAAQVISALPAHALAPLVPDASLAALLAQIESVTVAVITLEYEGQLLREPGFGYLIPSCEPADGVLGVIFDTCSFPQGDKTVLTVMSGGAEMERYYGVRPSRQRLLDAALHEVRRSLGVTARPSRLCVQLQERCIPQYRVGHRALVQEVRAAVGRLGWPLLLAGAAFDGVSVNDCILSGRRAAEAVSSAMDEQ
ncbi:protoporphyrinogen oxidase-like [Pollicipes pollicipes]|uniref:protoporphyrinogen oxidase-like n=1 Tax=Pollicipes pollicipes TaxID=41117 RepID=UPI00188543BF|nr:protoporphyrinogen oxidase-like [Pollicipes pollicipes]XP_037094618.1 protoporphyrinogen oxidase-like [Pollicipes pollicipes]